MTRILVIDDTSSHCQTIARMLQRHGFEVLTTTDANEGIEMAIESKPDLILMDVVMPGLNGFEATRQLTSKLETSSIPVVFLSSKDKTTDRHWGLKQGAKEYLAKPIQEPALLDAVQRILRKPSKTP